MAVVLGEAKGRFLRSSKQGMVNYLRVSGETLSAQRIESLV